MKVTRVGDHAKIVMKEWSRIGGLEPGTLVTYYVGAHVFDSAFAGVGFENTSGFVRMQMSNFVVVDGRLLKNRQLIEDLVEAYVLQGAMNETTSQA